MSGLVNLIEPDPDADRRRPRNVTNPVFSMTPRFLERVDHKLRSPTQVTIDRAELDPPRGIPRHLAVTHRYG